MDRDNRRHDNRWHDNQISEACEILAPPLPEIRTLDALHFHQAYSEFLGEGVGGEG